MEVCSTCQREVPTANAALHVLRCPGPPSADEIPISSLSSSSSSSPPSFSDVSVPYSSIANSSELSSSGSSFEQNLPSPSCPPYIPPSSPFVSATSSSSFSVPPVRSPSEIPSPAADGPRWNCPHCTFSNSPLLNICEICSQPRSLPASAETPVSAPLPAVVEQLISDYPDDFKQNPIPPRYAAPPKRETRWAAPAFFAEGEYKANSPLPPVRMITPRRQSSGTFELLAGSAVGGIMGALGAMWLGRRVETGIREGVFVGGLLGSAAASVNHLRSPRSSAGSQFQDPSLSSPAFPSPSAPPILRSPSGIMSSLPTHTVSGAPPYITCSICLGTCEPGHLVRTLPCFHMFHRHCIDPWITKEPTCPNCKFRVG